MNSILNLIGNIKRQRGKLKQGEKAITVVQRKKKGCTVVCYAKNAGRKNLCFIPGEKATAARG